MRSFAGKRAAEGVGDGFAAAAVEVDAGVAERGEREQVVGGPERGGEDVGDAGLAAAVAGVAFGHAVLGVELGGGGAGGFGDASWTLGSGWRSGRC